MRSPPILCMLLGSFILPTQALAVPGIEVGPIPDEAVVGHFTLTLEFDLNSATTRSGYNEPESYNLRNQLRELQERYGPYVQRRTRSIKFWNPQARTWAQDANISCELSVDERPFRATQNCTVRFASATHPSTFSFLEERLVNERQEFAFDYYIRCADLYAQRQQQTWTPHQFLRFNE